MALFSIITPMYNSEKYLHGYFFNVLNQKFKDFEIVCIDDNSTDGTLKTLERFQKTDGRIKVIHNQQNLGPGTSRNIGMEECHGEYVWFVDSDDMFPSFETLDVVANWIDKGRNPDVACGNLMFRLEFSSRISETISSEVDGSRKFNNDYVDSNYLQGVWYFQRYVFKRDFLLKNCCMFPNKRSYEDVIFLVSVLKIAGRVLCIDAPVYVYTQSDRFLERDMESEDKFIKFLDGIIQTTFMLKE